MERKNGARFVCDRVCVCVSERERRERDERTYYLAVPVDCVSTCPLVRSMQF